MQWKPCRAAWALGILLLVGLQSGEAAEAFLLPGEIILDESVGEVTGDSVSDRIYLVGSAKAKDRPASGVNIAVKDGADGAISRSTFSAVSGIYGRLFVADFNGDKVDDVMFAVQSGGEISCYAAAFNHVAPAVIYAADQRPRSGEILIGIEDRDQVFRVKSGSRIQLRLPENPSTGYAWYFNSFDRNYMDFLGQQNFVPEDQPEMVGKPGLKVFTLQTTGPGTVTLDLSNYRVWEGLAGAVDRFKVVLHIV